MSQDRFFFSEKTSEKKMQTQIPPRETVNYKFVSDSEMTEALHEMLLERNVAFKKIEQDAKCIEEMFKDLNTLVHNQKPTLDTINKTIDKTKDVAKSADKNLLEAEDKQKPWCVIC
jgi:hypothetical protein